MSFLRRILGRDDEPEHHHIDAPVPGWDAINAALEPLYGDEEPLHWGTIVRWRAGGPDPLDGVSAHRAPGPPPHWHYVSYGLSELYEKESDDADVSGWGMELTFRLARDAADDAAPIWPVSLMQNLARYVFESGNVLAVGDHMDLNGPIHLESDTGIRAIAFGEDQELGTIATPHGSVTFVQIVGLTMDEYQATQEWSTAAFLEVLRTSVPLLITDLGRTSILADPATAATVREGIARDGSSMGQIDADEVAWSMEGERATLTIGAILVPGLLRMLQGRLPFGQPLGLGSSAASVWITPGERLQVHDAGDGRLHIDMPTAVADHIIDRLRPVAGSYPIAPELTIEVEASVITDRDGRQIDIVG